MSWRGLWSVSCFLGLLVVTASPADEEQEKKGKCKAPKAEQGKVQVDLSKLPPDLAEKLRKFLKGEEKSAKMTKGKGKTTAVAQLPPGLARKPSDHPGHVIWLRARGYPPETAKGKGKGAPQAKGKGKGK